jgi:hypothetical protein
VINPSATGWGSAAIPKSEIGAPVVFSNETVCGVKLPLACNPKFNVEMDAVGGVPGANTEAEMGVTLFPVLATIASAAL